MTKYRINTKTNQVVEDKGNLGSFFFTDDWIEATDQEINNHISNTSKQTEIKELKQYLAETDWYYSRQLETGEAVPNDVKQKRIESRNRIKELQETESAENTTTESETTTETTNEAITDETTTESTTESES